MVGVSQAGAGIGVGITKASADFGVGFTQDSMDCGHDVCQLPAGQVCVIDIETFLVPILNTKICLEHSRSGPQVTNSGRAIVLLMFDAVLYFL